MIFGVRLTTNAIRSSNLSMGYIFYTNHRYSSIQRKVNFSDQESYSSEPNSELCLKTKLDITNYVNKIDSSTIESPYYIENGLRKVYPYYFKHATFCKGRWINRKLIDVYVQEFFLCCKERMEQRVIKGLLRVNNEIVDLDYTFKHKDLVTSMIHRHELPVLATSIKVLYEDEDFLVIDKPPSIPVHICSLYRHNSIQLILQNEEGRRRLYVTHRLDRLTSGVLIFAKCHDKAREVHEGIVLGNVKKEYLCRVEGNFPDGVVVCNKPLKQFHHKMGISLVNPSGKMCITEFEKLSFNGKSSVVICKPLTGRTHQIRAHLQYLGYPIVNDPLYNSYVFGPEKGKHGNLHKSIDQLLSDLLKEHCARQFMNLPNAEVNEDHEREGNLMSLISSLNYNTTSENMLRIPQKDDSKLTYDKDCFNCLHSFRDPSPSNLFMFLHAFRYQGEKWEFATEMPVWATANWDVM